MVSDGLTCSLPNVLMLHVSVDIQGGFIVGMLVGLGYFVFKIYRIFNQRETYQQVYKVR